MQLLEHFNELSLHPKNAKELKGLILQLAVDGKLTSKWRELNPNVETGEELLARINAEKLQLEKKKTIRKEKPLPKITKDEEKFIIPENWVWTHLGTIGHIFNGDSVNKSVKEAKYEGLESGYPYIATKDVEYSFEPINENNGVRIPFQEPKFKVARKGTVLICSEGGSAGKKMGMLTEDCCFGNKLYAIHQYGQIDSTYILCVYGSAYFGASFSEKMSGIIGGISRSNFIEIAIPIPPLAEQKAIVEVVNQLFAEVDQLETLTKERIHLKEDFATSALRQLSTGNTANEWAFLKDHFSTFFTEKSNIKKLRESILQLAVQGKLTADWRSKRTLSGVEVEHASELLARIIAEKEKLVKEKKIKKEKPLPKISEEEIPYELPEGWVWCRIGDGSVNLDGNRVPLSKIVRAKRQGDFDYYGAQGVIDHIDYFIFNKSLLLVAEDGGNLLRRTKPVAFVAHGKFWVNNHAHVIDSIDEITKFYLEIYINSIDLSPYLNGQPPMQIKLNRGKLNLITFSLPPLEEQKVIVEKVNALMALCDELELAVAESKSTQEKWMASSLREVFEGEEKILLRYE